MKAVRGRRQYLIFKLPVSEDDYSSRHQSLGKYSGNEVLVWHSPKSKPKKGKRKSEN